MMSDGEIVREHAMHLAPFSTFQGKKKHKIWIPYRA